MTCPVNRGKLLMVSGAIALLAFFFFFDPSVAGLFPPCPFKKLTGLNCPGCGSQRALHALLHLHIGDAIRFNPLLFAAIPFLLYDRIAAKGPLRYAAAPWFVLGIIVFFWIIRNLPFYPY